MFIHDDFLLHSEAARRLYHEYAADNPILDFHSHLSPQEIAENRRFANLYEIWLAGDHYKWRAMRAGGENERVCTGNATDKEKFLAWARVVPRTLGNPLYHWTHLELKRYFGIDVLLDESTADVVWQTANQQLDTEALSVQGILASFKVRCVCTTDDPADDLTHHQSIGQSDCATRVFPTFRPDVALSVDRAEPFNAWVDRLGAVMDRDIGSLHALLDAMSLRHEQFHEIGCRLSDHGLPYCHSDFPSDSQAQQIFNSARCGKSADPEQHNQWAAYMMLHFARWDAQRNWTKQLHLGAMRNNSRANVETLGPDRGFDSIGDWRQGSALATFLSRCQQENALPRIVLYNSNPVDNYLFASMAGNFQDGSFPSKIQFGSGWWFADQKEGMERQIRALASVGLLSGFIGMLTDSRSFLSFPRHEYFRRILCNLLGRDMANGELPGDYDLVGPMVRRICFQNALDYLGLDV